MARDGMSDEDLRDLLRSAAEEPRVEGEDELLEVLMARIVTDRGADVADALEPPPFLSAIPGTGGGAVATADARSASKVTSLSARGRRGRVAGAAGIGIAGWVAIGIGSAAAAATAGALITGVPLFGGGEDPTPAPTPSIERAAAAGQDEDADDVTGAITAPQASPDADTSHQSGTPDASDGSGVSQDSGDTPGGGTGSTSGGDLGGGLVGGVVEGADELVEEVVDDVDDLLPDGPVKDLVSPVIHSVDLSGLAGTLLCGDTAQVNVIASDAVGVEDVSLNLSILSVISTDISLDHAGGDTWTGTLAPLSLLDLGGLLAPLVDVTVVAEDAAGNSTTAQESLALSLFDCG